jgi:hypothetical protein
MSARNHFLAGCGAGVVAALATATLLWPRRQPRPQEKRPHLPPDPKAQADSPNVPRAADADESNGQSDPNSGPRIPATGHPAHAQETQDTILSSAEGPPGQETAPAASSARKRAWYRRLRATDYIIAVVAVMVVVVVAYISVAFRRLTNNMTAQLDQSVATMQELRQEVRVDQRAWIGLTEATIQPLTSDGGGFTIKLQNTGKTPALDVQVAAAITLEDIAQPLGPRAPNPAGGSSAGTMMPGSGYTTDVWFRTSPETLSSLAHEETRVVNLVLVTYKDVFQAPHSSTICFYWHSSVSRVMPCDSYNQLN